MNRIAICECGFLFLVGLGVPGVQAQQPVAAEPQVPSRVVQTPRELVPALPVPRLVKFAGVLKDEQGKPRNGVLGATFAIYREQESGAALWMETQNAEMDEQGHYTILLGATKSEGLPLDLFSSGEPRWLGVQVNLPGEVEQPRVLLVSVPYALKAADADTLGGKPLTAFLTNEQVPVGGVSSKSKGSTVSTNVSGTGTPNVLPKWLDTLGTLGDSAVSESGGVVAAPAYGFSTNVSPPTTPVATIFNQANVGPVFSGLSFKVRTGFSTPTDALSVDPNQNVSIAGNTNITGNTGALAYTFTGNATPPTTPVATIFNQANVGPVFSGLSFKVRTGLSTPVDALTVDFNQRVGIGTSAPSQKLEVAGNVKISGGGNALVFSDGTVMSSAATGVGGGTITGVTAGTGLSGGGTSGGVTLNNTGVLSFNGRPGAVTPTLGDYSFSQISGAAISAQLPVASLVRAITYLAGCDNCSVLTNADSQSTIFQNLIGAMTVNSVTCFSDSGAPAINIQVNHGGSLSNVLSSNLTCSNSGATSTGFSTGALSLNDILNFTLVADGVAKRVTMVIKATVN